MVTHLNLFNGTYRSSVENRYLSTFTGYLDPAGTNTSLSMEGAKLTTDAFCKSPEIESVPAKTECTNVSSTSGVSTREKVSTEGTEAPEVLANAPSPDITVKGDKKKARIIVNLNENVLYLYDKTGKPIKAFLVASGRKSTPTPPGAMVVSHVEKYPYSTAYGTKRKQNPSDYGPWCIILRNLDTETGESSQTGVFIHGNHDASSLGHYRSGGCVRMSNNVIKHVADHVSPGDVIIMKK